MSRLLGAQTEPGLLAYAAHGLLRICTGGEQAEVVVGVDPVRHGCRAFGRR
jgi:hypothetical protein